VKKREKVLLETLSRFVCSNITMTFKALLYKYYTRRGPRSAGSKWQKGLAPLEFFNPLYNLGPFLALGSSNKYSNKIIAKMLHLSTQTYNNKQVSKVFMQNFS